MSGPKEFKQVATYLGGHPDAVEAQKSSVLRINGSGIQAGHGFRKPILEFAWSDITGLAAEGQDEVSKRVTITRLATIGLFAFAAKKQSKDRKTWITVTTKTGDAIFELDKQEPHQVQAMLNGFRPLMAVNSEATA